MGTLLLKNFMFLKRCYFFFLELFLDYPFPILHPCQAPLLLGLPLHALYALLLVRGGTVSTASAVFNAEHPTPPDKEALHLSSKT